MRRTGQRLFPRSWRHGNRIDTTFVSGASLLVPMARGAKASGPRCQALILRTLRESAGHGGHIPSSTRQARPMPPVVPHMSRQGPFERLRDRDVVLLSEAETQNPLSESWGANRTRTLRPVLFRHEQKALTSISAGQCLDPECPRQDSNLRTRLRRPMLYPLSYGGVSRCCSATGETLPAPTGCP